MTTSPTTFEHDLRQRLLDAVYSQWHDLGVPFSEVRASNDVIDPEALIWCSLEFLPTEPRLCENVIAWLHRHDGYVIRQRLRKRAKGADPRSQIWHILDKLQPSADALAGILPSTNIAYASRPSLIPTIEHKARLESGFGKSLAVADHDVEAADFAKFCGRLEEKIARHESAASRIGNPITKPSTLLLKARNLLGNDSRHFLLVYLLANPAGGRLRDIQRWTGYSYRTTSEVATKWESAGIAVIDHGYCRLTDLQPWQTLLRQGSEQIALVNFFQLFEACIDLSRALAKARRKNLGLNSSVVAALRRDAYNAISTSPLGDRRNTPASITYLGELFTDTDKAIA